jgi:hypothetical protein
MISVGTRGATHLFACAHPTAKLQYGSAGSSLSAFSARRLDHRHLRVLWLHPAHERGCDRSLHAREGRHPRGGAAGQAASDGCRDPACTARWCIGSAQRGLGNDRAARSASLRHGAVRNIDTAVRLTRLAALDAEMRQASCRAPLKPQERSPGDARQALTETPRSEIDAQTGLLAKVFVRFSLF